MRAVLVPFPLPASEPWGLCTFFAPLWAPWTCCLLREAFPDHSVPDRASQQCQPEHAVPCLSALPSLAHSEVLSPTICVPSSCFLLARVQDPCGQDLVHARWTAAPPAFSLAGGLLGLRFGLSQHDPQSPEQELGTLALKSPCNHPLRGVGACRAELIAVIEKNRIIPCLYILELILSIRTVAYIFDINCQLFFLSQKNQN